jgi:hypothetical protein
MEPGQVLVSLLYLWLLIAVGIYAWRAYRRIAHNETRADRAERRGAGTTGDDRPVSEVTRPGPASAAARAPIVPARPSVAELVEGITLPCGLIPVIGDELDPHRVTFATTGHPAGEVSTALADELERLGFELHPESGTETVARRGDVALRVRILGEADRPDRAGHPDPTRVVAELSS